MSNDSSKHTSKHSVPKKLHADESEPKLKPLSTDVTWGPAPAILVTVLTFFVAQLVTGIAIGLVLASVQWTNAEMGAWLDTVPGQFTFVVIAEALTLLMLWWFLRRQRASVRALGFHRNPVWKDLGYVAAGFAVYFVLLIGATLLARLMFGVDTEQKQDLGFDEVSTGSHKLMAFVSLVLLPPIVEEVLFRGFLYGGLRRTMGVLAATMFTSLLFAAPHLLESKSGLLWIGAVDTFVLSVVLCYLREKTGNLWASIGVHAIKNGLAFIYLFVLAH